MSNLNTVTVAIGADHGGFPLKEELKSHLAQKGYRVIDCGTFGTESVDYPRFAFAVADKVSKGASRFGVIVDGAGIGSAMVANKVKNVRAALCYDLSTARNAREHNNANVLTLGAGLVGASLAKQIAETFLTHKCTVDRHLMRVKMIDDLDAGRTPSGTVGSNGSQSTKAAISGEEMGLTEFSSEDIQRIAERIQSLLAVEGGGVEAGATAATCGDEACTDCGHCADKTPETVRQFIGLGATRFSHAPGGRAVPEDIARCIDHTLLKADASVDDIKKLCAEAREYNFASVCVNPTFVPLARKELTGTPVDVCTVVGFPLGTHMSEIKGIEARRAIREGAREIDMVINIGALKSGDDELVYRDIRMVTEACEDGSALSKVIIETALLTDDEKERACRLAKRARANYVKTSTGFGPGGATEKDVALMSGIVSAAGLGVKASGGIKDFDDARKMIAAGATRLGASAGLKIVQGAKEITISN